MAEAKTDKKKMPKGGRKGGSIFPRIDLEQAVAYAKRLVSKTHTGPQPKDVVYSGVFDVKGATGNERISALKQYGFAEGDAKSGFEASRAAKLMAAAPLEELVKHYRKATLGPKIFKALFDTFHGDKVSRAKLKQRAADLKVHPDKVDACVDNYVSSALLADLIMADGDDYLHVSHADLAAGSAGGGADSDDSEGKNLDPDAEIEADAERQREEESEHESERDAIDQSDAPPPRAIFNVNVSLDSSLDTEKLEKQLALLKRYGAI